MLAEILWHYTSRVNAGRIRRLFRPKVRLSFEKGNYLVKTIENVQELDAVMRLRYEVFHREQLNKKFAFGLDTEEFDHVADHLVIVDRGLNKIVGCYRLISSAYSKNFYSQTEFNLDSFLARPGIKLELSRACIHRDFRKGVVMNLLWRGLVQYIQQVEAAYLFGCASIKTMDPAVVTTISSYLEGKNFIDNALDVAPLSNFEMPPFEGRGVAESGDTFIPPLLSSYLRAGAKVAAKPALDREFKCVDYLTVLRMSDITRLFERKYTAC